MITQTENTEAKSTVTQQQRLDIRIQKHYDVKVSSCAYLTDDYLIALGNQDGSIQVIASNNGNNQYYLKSLDKSPVTSISLNPDHVALKNAIIVTHSGGTLQYWHTTSKQLLFEKKYQEFLFCSDIRSDANKYVFGGQHGEVRISNMDKSNPTILQQGHLGSHQNRVFCVKWDPNNINCLYSGGWDKTVYFWDIRTKTAAHKLFGCYIGGQSLDIWNNSNQYPIKVYDMKADKMSSVKWIHQTQESKSQVTGVLSCFFGKDQLKTIVAQSAKNQIRVFQQGICVKRFQEQAGVKAQGMSKASKSRQLIAIWDNGNIQIMKY